MLEGKRAVVTGGAGFIGSHIAEALIARGCHVTIFDNLSSGNMANIEYMLNQKSVEIVKASIMDIASLRQAFKGADFIFHLAAITSLPYSVAHPKTTNDINVTGTLNVLLASRESGVKKIIYASTSAVYGESRVRNSEYMTPNPQTPYAVSKLAGEYYGAMFQRLYHMKFASLRYFNVYGARQTTSLSDGAVVPSFISRVTADQPPVINGDGEQCRDFVYVKDVVDASVLAAGSKMEGVFNVGTSTGTTVNNLARLVLDIYGRDGIKPTHAKERPGDTRNCVADIGKVRGYGFSPRYCLAVGLKDMLEVSIP